MAAQYGKEVWSIKQLNDYPTIILTHYLFFCISAYSLQSQFIMHFTVATNYETATCETLTCLLFSFFSV